MESTNSLGTGDQMTLNIQPFIFNWKGQYNKTCKIQSDLSEIFDSVTVINSDDDNQKSDWVNIGEESYFADQFLKAIELFDGDVFFHIQGDVEFDQWKELVDSAIKYYEEFNWGIYAPNVDYTWYSSDNADINTVEFRKHPNLRMVSNPDCTVWFIHKDIIDVLKNTELDLSFLRIGWGLDLILCANSFLQKRFVIRDYDFKVNHPRGTGYAQHEAMQEMNLLLSKCSKEYQETIHTIRFYKDHLCKFFGG